MGILLQLHRVSQPSVIVLDPSPQPECSPVKDSANLDQDYVPPHPCFNESEDEEDQEPEEEAIELYNKNAKCEIFLLTNYCILFFYKLLFSRGGWPPKRKKILSFLSCLMQLFQLCPMCQQPAAAEVSRVVGTLIQITQKCHTNATLGFGVASLISRRCLLETCCCLLPSSFLSP